MIHTQQTMYELLHRDDFLTKEINNIESQIVDQLYLEEAAKEQKEKAMYQGTIALLRKRKDELTTEQKEVRAKFKRGILKLFD